MMNDHARRLLDPADQSVLLGHATQALAEGRRSTATIALPTGGKVRVQAARCPASSAATSPAAWCACKLIESEEAPDQVRRSMTADVPARPGRLGAAVAALLPRRRRSYGRGEWLVLAGERGVGKSALARCVHQRRQPDRPAARARRAVATPAGHDDLRRELLEDPVDALVIRHVDRLAGKHWRRARRRAARGRASGEAPVGRGHAGAGRVDSRPGRAAGVLPAHGRGAAAAPAHRGPAASWCRSSCRLGHGAS